MKPKEFIEGVISTENQDWENIKYRTSLITTIRLDHAADGMITEAGEFKDVLRKYKFYGKDYSEVDLVEEIGDILYFVALALDELGFSFEEAMAINNAKLRARYKDGFSQREFLVRNLDREVSAMEGAKDGEKTPNSD